MGVMKTRSFTEIKRLSMHQAVSSVRAAKAQSPTAWTSCLPCSPLLAARSPDHVLVRSNADGGDHTADLSLRGAERDVLGLHSLWIVTLLAAVIWVLSLVLVRTVSALF
jgi:hypothetical protein